MQLQTLKVTALFFILSGISKVIAQTTPKTGEIYTKSYTDCDTIFLKGGNIRLVKFVKTIKERTSYKDCHKDETVYEMTSDSYDSIKIGETKMYNYKYEPVSSYKKIYFEGSFGGGILLHNVGIRALVLTGSLSIGYQLKSTIGFGISNINHILSDGNYVYNVNSLTSDYRLYDNNHTVTFHAGFVTRLSQWSSDNCKFDVHTISPSLGLSWQYYLGNNFMLGARGLFLSVPISCYDYDSQTKTAIWHKEKVSSVVLNFQLGFSFPKRLKEVRIQ